MPDLIRKIEPGDVIGRCRAIRELGRGGVGTVYLATHQTLQIEVALKILSPALSMDNPALAERFIREAQMAARIRHPNVIAVMDAAHDDATGLYYMVMEYVAGGALSWHLRHGPLPEAKCLAIVTGIAHALAIAEENRIVHRDIKPDNIMLDLRGTPKLADLGLAKQVIDSHTSLTLGGSFMGTPAYMSPEQARDAKVADTRDDIYSLGATFYECLTGEPPFQGETPYNIMSELLTKPSPKPSTLRPDLSRSMDLICRKMMAKSRHLRYPNARALLDDLIICHTFGDSGLDRLDACNFEQEAATEQRQALSYGVQTSAEGVYVPDLPEDEEDEAPPVRDKSVFSPPRRSDQGIFGMALLLVSLVTMAVLILAWAAPQHPFSWIKQQYARVFGGPGQLAPPDSIPAKEEISIPAVPPAAHPAKTHLPHLAKPDKPPVDVAPANSNEVIAPRALPVVLPVDPAAEPPAALTDSVSTNVSPALPAIPFVGPPSPAPVPTVATDSAFTARTIAEATLDPKLINPGTGLASLLKILGHRDESQLSPSTWIFYFFDKAASGNARIVTVSGGKVVKNREDVANIVSPYSEDMILPTDQMLIDSSQVLSIASALLPGVTVTGSELLLMQPRNSVPLWKVTLWATESDGGNRRMAEVTILAAGGAIIQKNLHP